MSDEAGIRTPTYRVARRRGMDPATRRLSLIAAGLGSALLAVIGIWSVGGHGGGRDSVPVIQPPPGPMRVKPANPGGMQLTPTDEIMAQRSAGNSGIDKLAPPPEIPDPQALRPPPKPAAAVPVAAPKPPPVATASKPPPAVAAAKPVQPAKPAAAPTPVPAPTKTAATPAAGRAEVQLAALSTEAAATQEWALLQHRLSDLLHGREPAISKVEVNGHVWWRLRTGGFADAAAARGFCEQIRGKGAACDVVPR